jgi:mycoredoxin
MVNHALVAGNRVRHYLRAVLKPAASRYHPILELLHRPPYIEIMDIKVYSAFWCPDCRVAKRFLAKHNIAFTEIDIETTPGAAEEVIQRTGKRAIPQFVIDGEWVQPYRIGEGFLYEEMAQRLGVDTPEN